jgi:hypothetical protein
MFETDFELAGNESDPSCDYSFFCAAVLILRPVYPFLDICGEKEAVRRSMFDEQSSLSARGVSVELQVGRCRSLLSSF